MRIMRLTLFAGAIASGLATTTAQADQTKFDKLLSDPTLDATAKIAKLQNELGKMEMRYRLQKHCVDYLRNKVCSKITPAIAGDVAVRWCRLHIVDNCQKKFPIQ